MLIKSRLGATYVLERTASVPSDPNVVPHSVVGYDGDPGVTVRPREELLELAMHAAVTGPTARQVSVPGS